jgi:flagella basal body P-ring formation protein FlgA
MQKMTWAFVIALLTVGCLCEAAEKVTVRLRKAVQVGEGVIRLADVAELPASCPAAMAGVVLGNAPWPGNRRTVSRALVHVRMLASDIPSRRYELDGARICIVERRSLTISSAELAKAARRKLAELTEKTTGEIEVELVRPPRPVCLPEGEADPELRASIAGEAAPVGRVRMHVDVVRGDERLDRAIVLFDVKLWRRVATARRRIATGEALSGDNVAFVRREVSRSGSSAITSADDLTGRVAARPVRAGGLVDTAVLDEPERRVVVRRNQRVRLVARIGNLRAVALGKAEATARPGEVIKAVNLTTGREVAGVVQSDGSVQVLMGEE